ncbi:hypothetical protein C2E23DRAFT_740812 [Lenzites betulinus]|nr:hypothetical protein C2E23DRAFT_740812 [Lenzites betulinus]
MSHTFAAQPGGRHFDMGDVRGDQSDSPVILHVPYVQLSHGSPALSTFASYSRRNSPPLDPPGSLRYSPYPSPLSATTSRHAHSIHALDISPTASRPPVGRAAHPIGEAIKLPPIRPPNGRSGADDGSFHLPPISSMDNLREAQCGEPMAVLRRLQATDEPPAGSAPSSWSRSSSEVLAQRRHSLADPVYRRSQPSPALSVGAHSASGVLRTPLSAGAALPSQVAPPARHAQPEEVQQPRSGTYHSETTPPSGARGQPVCDDRLTQSSMPSPFLDAPRRDYRICHDERHSPQAEDRVHSRHDRPLSPPPSATSATSAGSSPAESARPSWRPW